MSADQNLGFIREILGSSFIELEIRHLELHEDVVEGRSRVRVLVQSKNSSTEFGPHNVEGIGVGLVDAFFHALREKLVPEYPSLSGIRFVGFSIKAQMEKIDSKNKDGTDALAEVTLHVQNSERKEFEFVQSSKSLTTAAVLVTLKAVEYFINSERAFFITRRALEDAKQRNRADLVSMFSSRLAELVQNTSYTDAIEKRQD